MQQPPGSQHGVGDGYPGIPLAEFDPDEPGLIYPGHGLTYEDVPRCAVLCFFAEIIESLATAPDVRVLGCLTFAHGNHLIYEVRRGEHGVLVIHPGVGGPLAGAVLEEVIALGCDTFVVCGGSGALVPDLALGELVVIDSALRDEGTSFHYLPPARTIAVDPRVQSVLVETARLLGTPCRVGRTWTTDGLYRETRSRVARRVAEGCITVDMEAASLLAVAAFRRVALGLLLYSGDSLAGVEWDERAWDVQFSLRQTIFEVAVAGCLAVASTE